MRLGGCDRAIPSQHEGAEQGAATALFSLPSPRTSHPSRESSRIRSPSDPYGPGTIFSEAHFKPASAALIFSVAKTSPRVPTIASRVTAAPAPAERACRWVFPYPGASDGEQRLQLRLPSPQQGLGASGSCLRTQWGGKQHPWGAVGPGQPHQNLILADAEHWRCR